jgi:hypothetical protein
MIALFRIGDLNNSFELGYVGVFSSRSSQCKINDVSSVM